MEIKTGNFRNASRLEGKLVPGSYALYRYCEAMRRRLDNFALEIQGKHLGKNQKTGENHGSKSFTWEVTVSPKSVGSIRPLSHILQE